MERRKFRTQRRNTESEGRTRQRDTEGGGSRESEREQACNKVKKESQKVHEEGIRGRGEKKEQ